MRAAIPTLRTRTILRAHADHVDAWAGRQPADLLRVAAWRLEAGEEIDPVLAESAAMLARHAGDFPLMLRLARAAHAGRPTMRTGILLGEALYETGGWPESEAVLAAADSLEGTPAEVLRLVGQRGTNLLFGLLDPDRARRVTDDAAPRLAGEGLGSLRDELAQPAGAAAGLRRSSGDGARDPRGSRPAPRT